MERGGRERGEGEGGREEEKEGKEERKEGRKGERKGKKRFKNKHRNKWQLAPGLGDREVIGSGTDCGKLRAHPRSKPKGNSCS